MGHIPGMDRSGIGIGYYGTHNGSDTTPVRSDVRKFDYIRRRHEMKSLKKMEREARLKWLTTMSLTVEHAHKAGIPATEIMIAVMNGLGINPSEEEGSSASER